MKNELHARAIADLIGTNHTSVNNHLRNLITMNVLGYRTEGRNKSYHLKNSIEAREYVHIAEHFTLIEAIGRYPELRSLAHKVHGIDEISLAVIFGSYANGTARDDSDIDLFIEMMDTDDDLKTRLGRMHSRLSVKMGPFDPTSHLISEIIRKHVILKGVERFHEKAGILR